MTDTTTRNLAREVAIALGWRIVHPDWMGEGHYELYMPDGRMVYDNGFGVLTDEGIDGALPNHPNDLNACARDLTREGWDLIISQRGDMWGVVYYPDDYYSSKAPSTRSVISAPKSKQLAVAWCESFLALSRTAQEEG